MKWGTRYPADFVNKLWSMIKRNTTRPTRLVCFTDDGEGVNEEVKIYPLPEYSAPERAMWNPWRKVSLWQSELFDLEGDVLFLDLDMIITGHLDEFFDYESGKYCVIHNWRQPKLQIGNTSLFRFRIGQHSHIYDDFMKDPEAVMAKYEIEQQYISGEISEQRFWPNEWVLSFKHSLLPKWPLNFFITPKLPKSAKAIAFTGKPDPDEAAIGVWPLDGKAAWKKLYKHVRSTPWILENWK
jgi:hypothetical protein